MSTYYLGIDIGTGTSKAALIDERCTPMLTREVSHTLDTPHPGWLGCDAEEVIWGDCIRLCRSVLEGSGIAATDIECVGLSCMGCDCIAIDREGTALAPAILYGADSRTTEEIAWINDHYQDQAEKLFGHEVCTSDVAPKILWLKRHEPEAWEGAAAFLTGSSYLCAKLCGNLTIDSYLAEDFMPLYHLAARTPNAEGCEPFCKPSQLAQIMSATDIAGTVTEKAAEATGLAPGTPVLVGTGDSGAEAISTGVFLPGDVMVQLGSSAYVIALTDTLVDEPRLWPGTFVIPGTYGICAGTNTAGSLLAWMRNELYPDALADQDAGGPNAFEVMAREAASSVPGAHGLLCLPYFAGERTPLNDPLARGSFFGLSTSHTRADLTRAAIEGVAFSVWQILDVLDQQGVPCHKVMCVGGGTKNEVWLQTTANMLERPVHTTDITIGAAYGDALMAALASGAYGGWEELAELVRPQRTIEPQPELYPVYRRIKAQLTSLYTSTRELAHELAGQQGV